MTRALIFIFSVFLSLPVLGAQVQSVRVGQHPDKARVVFDLTDEQDFQVKLEDNPKRLTIHLPAKQWSVNGDTVLSAPIKSIAHEKTISGLMKITMPLSAPHIVQTAFMIEGSPHRLVIDLKPTTELKFKEQIGRPHGPLAINQDVLGDLIASFEKDAQTPYPISKPKKRVKPIVMIDAGHGGKDPGAVSKIGIYEKDITLPMAKMMAKILNDSGRYNAKLTRSDDRYIKLYNRVKIARKAKSDLFISVHADSVRNSQTRGASVYTLSDKASDKQTAKLAARENKADLIGGIDLNVEDEEVSAILIDLSMRESMNQSKDLANIVINGLRRDGVETLRGPHRYAGFAVLKAPDIPSILIETGFVSNNSQAREMLKPAFHRKFANSLLKSLDKHFGF